MTDRCETCPCACSAAPRSQRPGYNGCRGRLPPPWACRSSAVGGWSSLSRSRKLAQGTSHNGNSYLAAGIEDASEIWKNMNDDLHSKKQTSCWKKHGQDVQHQSLSDSDSRQKEKVGKLRVSAQRESGKTSFNKILVQKGELPNISLITCKRATMAW